MNFLNRWNRKKLALLFADIFCLTVLGDVGVNGLVCEYHVNPIGIDVEKPRLSWKIYSNERNILQSAYEIKVAETELALSEGRNLRWSTGKVLSNQSTNVEYNGSALLPMQRVFWQVRVWTEIGKPTQWSAPAYWDYKNCSKTTCN